MLALVALESEADEQRRGRQDCCVPRVAPVSAPHLHPAEWHPHLMPWHQVTMLCNSCLHLLMRKWNQVTMQFLLRPVNKKMKPGHSSLQFLLTPVNKKMEPSYNALQFLLTPVNKKMAPAHNGNADSVFCIFCNSFLYLSLCQQEDNTRSHTMICDSCLHQVTIICNSCLQLLTRRQHHITMLCNSCLR